MKKYLCFLFILAIAQSTYTQCWNLVWEDEFNGTSVDVTKWEAEIGGGGWGNNELQYYTDRTLNASVSAGTLKINALQESYNGASYTSARLRTKNLGDWTYGKMEARLKQPIGQGIWPAFWMLPTDNIYGFWPSSGEIDVMEYLGHQPSRVHGTAHWGTNPPYNHNFLGDSYTKASGTYNDGFSIYTVEWEPTEIRWYVDGVQYHSLTPAMVSPFNWPFDQRFHLLLNVAVGGNWPGAPDATTIFPQEMEVDWVRVYQEVDDIAIVGLTTAEPCTSATYTLPNISGASYAWTLPDGANLVSGAGTSAITVNWSHLSGTIDATITTACGSASTSLVVNISRNKLQNPSFEQDFSGWNLNAYNGGSAAHSIITSNVQDGNKAVCVDVTAIGVNPWNVQMNYGNLDLDVGKSYIFHFWAKSNTPSKQVRANILNASTYANYAAQLINLTNTWTEYTLSLTATATVSTIITFDLGFETGEVCIDNAYFAEDVAPLLLQPRAYLQGPHDTSLGLMNDDLRSNNLLPLQEPFSAAGFIQLAPGGGETTTTAVFSITGSDAIVDWVLVELRDKNDASRIMATRSALLQRDGDIVDVDGVSSVNFDVCADDYYVAIRHRNHLSVMSAGLLNLN